MLDIEIPGRGKLQIKNIVLDVNGTVCIDGHLVDELPSLAALLRKAWDIDLYLITAATRGIPEKEAERLGAEIEVVSGDEAGAKQEFVKKLGSSNTAAIGNGSNDVLMLKEAAVGVAVVQKEGASAEAILSADVVVTNIVDAFELFLHPDRLKATLRK